MRHTFLILLLCVGAWLAAHAGGPATLPNAPSAEINAGAVDFSLPPEMLPGSRPLLASTFIARPAPRKRKVADRNFVLFSVLAAGLSIADMELTQRCEDRGRCVELNPLLPRSRAGKYAVVMPFNAGLFYWAYQRKAAGKRKWWLAPLLIVGAHSAGTADNLRFVGRK